MIELFSCWYKDFDRVFFLINRKSGLQIYYFFFEYARVLQKNLHFSLFFCNFVRFL